MRGRLTMRAVSGAAIGTWMTSMLKSAVFGSWLGSSREQPGELLGGTDGARARAVDVQIGLVVGIDEQRVRYAIPGTSERRRPASASARR